MGLEVISILLPVHNEAGHLRRTVASALSQSYRDLELIVIDDGSTDGTREEVESYRRADPRVRVISQSKAGIASALNRGLALASGKLVARIDAGDVAMPQWLESQCDELGRDPRIDVIFGRVVLVDPVDRPFYVFPLTLPSNTTTAVRSDKSYPHPFVVCKKGSLERIGGYPARDGIEDFLLWRTLAESGATLAANPRIVGLQARTAAHNDVIESRYRRRYRDLPRLEYERALLKAYMERRIIYPSNLSPSAARRFDELRRRYPLSAVRSLVRATAMAAASRLFIKRYQSDIHTALAMAEAASTRPIH